MAYVVGIHEIHEPDGFWAAAAPCAASLGSLRLHCVYPLVNGFRAVSLWEGESVEAVGDRVETLLGDFGESEFYEVDRVAAVGLPG